MLAPPLASTVATVMSLGFTARETIPIVFFGFAICSVVITLTGKMGAKVRGVLTVLTAEKAYAYVLVQHPIPSPGTVNLRDVRFCCCDVDCHTLVRIATLPETLKLTVFSVQAGAFLQCCIEAIWPSFKRFPNHLSPDAGITSAGLLCFFIYWIFQTMLALMPIQKLRILFLVKGVVVPPTFLALFLWGVIVTHGGGPLVTGKVKLTSSYMNTAYSSLTGLNAIIGLFSSMAVNIFSKNNLAGYHQFFALPVIGTLGALTPIFVTSAHSFIWGEFEWYMPAVIEKFDSRAAKFFTALSFMLATIGNQIAAGTYPFSNDVSGIYPKYINIFRATIFISIFCVISTPWNIIKNAAGLLAFLSGYSCLMGPLAGVMVSDYYLIKERRLNVHELYRDRGIYYYSHGFNWRAYAAFLVGFAPLIPGFAKSIDNNLDVSGAWKIYTFAWLFGFSISLLTYYVICTFVSPISDALVDTAVLPPQRGDRKSSEDEVFEGKGQVTAHTTEVSAV
ncbi:MAG: hypothetical protein LQ351_004694 [Letrouitia transgressa]|nr:MAG: hypothetical protein LQ351_004694 [Letrouitia transgressa]